MMNSVVRTNMVTLNLYFDDEYWEAFGSRAFETPAYRYQMIPIGYLKEMPPYWKW